MTQTPVDSVLTPSGAPPAPAAPISPRVCEIACAALLLTLVLAPASLLNSDGDTAHHLLVGQIILAQHSIPAQDIFSHAHLGQPFLDWEWLSEVLFAGANLLLGLNGVAILAATLIAGTLYLLCRWLMAQGLHPVPALVVGMLAAVTSEIHWLARPHLFSFLFILLVLYLLEEYRSGRLPATRLALVPLIMAIWANTHAAFVIGLACCGAYLAGAMLEWAVARYRAQPQPAARAAAQTRIWALTTLAAGAATLINPYGFGLYIHISSFLQNSFLTRIIVEYQPPNPRNPIIWAFGIMLLGMLIVLARTWRRIPAAHLILLAAWTYLALQAARNILQFSVVVPALLAPQLIYLLNQPRQGKRTPLLARYRSRPDLRLGPPWVLGATLLSLIVLAALGGRIGSQLVLRARWTEPPFPIQAVAFIQQQNLPQSKMFNNMTWGGYLLYTLYPRYHIFIDGQQDAYGEALSRDYLTIELAGPGWETLLSHYAIDWVIEVPTTPLAAALRADAARWRVLYEDPTAVILVRR
ncbi:MAG TPA: hypothetical protein VKY74_22685 [Chloroflexia bacterium]|nr:hypothetical protein [Chloroflexia bacterium]